MSQFDNNLMDVGSSAYVMYRAQSVTQNMVKIETKPA